MWLDCDANLLRHFVTWRQKTCTHTFTKELMKCVRHDSGRCSLRFCSLKDAASQLNILSGCKAFYQWRAGKSSALLFFPLFLWINGTRIQKKYWRAPHTHPPPPSPSPPSAICWLGRKGIHSVNMMYVCRSALSFVCLLSQSLDSDPSSPQAVETMNWPLLCWAKGLNHVLWLHINEWIKPKKYQHVIGIFFR